MSREVNLSIQGLKGVAGLVVFFSHSLWMYDLNLVAMLSSTPWHIFWDGQCAVMIFFAISGFFYAHNELFSFNNYIRGLVKKVKRIYPAYIVTMILAFVMCNLSLDYIRINFTEWSNSFWQSRVPLFELIKQLFILIPSDTKLINPPVWYMVVEVRMFILMPLIVYFANRFSYKWKFLVYIAFLTLGLFVYRFLFCFIIGLLIHLFIDNSVKFRNWLSHSRINSLFLLLASIIMLDVRNIFLGDDSTLLLSIQSIAAAMIVAVVYLNRFKCLLFKPIVYMGNISYEFYLIHFVVLLSFKTLETFFTLYIILSLLVSIMLAIIINKLVNNLW